MDENETARVVVDAAYHVHVALGPGLLESVYERILAYELAKRGLAVRRQVFLPVRYDGHDFDEAFRIDLLINDKVIVELKSLEEIQPVHRKQLMTYLKLADKRLGLLLNFGKARMKDGIERVANGMPD
ncbi:UNVERIFIED_CONTAM: GxxExxY protein [Euhalothece sp. KZN 001]